MTNSLLFNRRVRESLLGTNPLNCLKTGTNTLADSFRAEQIRGPERIRCYNGILFKLGAICPMSREVRSRGGSFYTQTSLDHCARTSVRVTDFYPQPLRLRL